MDVGDTVWLRLDPSRAEHYGTDRLSATVRKVTPRRVYAWLGWTGFGQRVWAFDAKGRPVDNECTPPRLAGCTLEAT